MIRRFFEQAQLYHKGRRAAFSGEEFALMQVGYPLVTLIFYCLIASYSFQTGNLTTWVIGNAFLLCTNACIFGLGNVFRGERYTGRLRSIIASPSAKLPLILASGLYPALFAVIASVCGFLVGSLVFGVDFSGVNLGLAALAILCAMASATCFGLFLSVFGLMSDSMHLVLNVVSYLLMIFTGAEFPVSQLPLFGRVIAQLMPLTKAIAAMNSLFGPEQGTFWTLMLAELATGAVYAILARVLFGFAERCARRNGQFDLF
ncbi:MAG: ABC transporter permease [Oscillospiraceae bacterium]|nr:ABC transporter permease [Oscillospiraceae bacterium]